MSSSHVLFRADTRRSMADMTVIGTGLWTSYRLALGMDRSMDRIENNADPPLFGRYLFTHTWLYDLLRKVMCPRLY